MSSLIITFPNPNGLGIKNHTVKVFSNTLLSKVIEEVCDKYSLGQSDGFALKFNKKIIDSSLTFRFSNIKPNSKLELVKVHIKQKANTNAELGVALQTNDGHRIIEKFTVSTTLLRALFIFEQKHNNENSSRLLQQNTDGKWLTPVCQILNREIFGLEQLATTTFLNLGLKSGNVMIRLTFKPCEDSIEKVKEELNKLNSLNQENISNDVNDVLSITSEESNKSKVIERQAIEPKVEGNQEESSANINENKVQYLAEEKAPSNERDRHIYLAPPETKPFSQQIQIPDSHFELNSTELRLALAQQQNTLKQLQEGAPLMTKKMREQLQQKKLEKYPITNIRVKFPNMVVVQLKFKSNEPFNNLISEIKLLLSEPDRDFYLFQSPPVTKFVNVEEKTFHQLELYPASLLYFKFTDNRSIPKDYSYLKEAEMDKAETLPELKEIPILLESKAQDTQQINDTESKLHSPLKETPKIQTKVPSSSTQSKVEKPTDSTKAKISKWLRLSKP